MKKIFFTLCLIIFSFVAASAYAEKNIVLIMFGSVMMLPFITFAGPSMLAAQVPMVIYETNYEPKRLRREYYDKITNHSLCPLLKGLYINADEVDMFIGKEQKGQSNIKTAENFKDEDINISVNKYLCINPQSSIVYKNGCLDTLKEKSVEKVKGNWYLYRAFTYHSVDYVQLRSINSNQVGFTDVSTAIEHVYYNGEKINLDSIKNKQVRFDLESAIELNCKNKNTIFRG